VQLLPSSPYSITSVDPQTGGRSIPGGGTPRPSALNLRTPIGSGPTLFGNEGAPPGGTAIEGQFPTYFDAVYPDLSNLAMTYPFPLGITIEPPASLSNQHDPDSPIDGGFFAYPMNFGPVVAPDDIRDGLKPGDVVAITQRSTPRHDQLKDSTLKIPPPQHDNLGTNHSSWSLNRDRDAGAPAGDSDFSVRRGAAATVSLLWNEADDAWTITNDGVNYRRVAAWG